MSLIRRSPASLTPAPNPNGGDDPPVAANVVDVDQHPDIDRQDFCDVEADWHAEENSQLGRYGNQKAEVKRDVQRPCFHSVPREAHFQVVHG